MTVQNELVVAGTLLPKELEHLDWTKVQAGPSFCMVVTAASGQQVLFDTIGGVLWITTGIQYEGVNYRITSQYWSNTANYDEENEEVFAQEIIDTMYRKLQESKTASAEALDIIKDNRNAVAEYISAE